MGLLRPAAAAASLLVLASIWTACGRGTPPRPREIVIGVIAPMSGDRFVAGRPTLDGATLAVEHRAAAGGLRVGDRRMHLRLIGEDDEGRPETAVGKAFKLIRRDGAVALTGLPVSESAMAVAQVAEEHGIPLVSSLATAPELTTNRSHVYRLVFSDEVQGLMLARLAVARGARRAAVLTDAGSAYSRGLTRAFRRAFESQGERVVAAELFTADELDVTEQISRIAAGSPDVLLLPNDSMVLPPLLRQIRDSGLTAVLLGGDSWGLLDFASTALDRQAFFTDVWVPETDNAATKEFVAAFSERFGRRPRAVAALAYDAVQLVASAIEARQSAQPAHISEELAQTVFEGVTGTILFGGSGEPRRTTVIRRIDRGGAVRLHRVVEPDLPAETPSERPTR